MTPRVLRPAITLTFVMAILVTAIAAYAFLNTRTTHADPVFFPVVDVKLCNDLPSPFVPDASMTGGAGTCAPGVFSTSGAQPDVTTTLDVPSGNLNFASVVTLAPKDQIIAPGGDIVVGTKIGGLHSETRLGTLNGACNILFPVDFVFFNVALPNMVGGRVDTSTNIVYPYPEGTPVRFGAWKLGSPPDPNEPTGLVTDPGGQAVVTGGFGANIANGTTASIQNYPSHLLRYFDMDDPPVVPGGGDSLRPHAVYGGLTKVAGTEWVPLYYVQFVAGGLATHPEPSLAALTVAMGQPSVAVLNDPTATVASPNTITDFCTPLSVTSMLLGLSSGMLLGGAARTENPAAGTHFYTHYIASLRDTDADSYENAIDTCPLVVNAGSPRIGLSGDPDNDGIDASCDPAPTGGPSDFDGDGFENRQDNCPLATNVNQLDSELGAGPAADGGPRVDNIGDVCDSEGGTNAFTQNGVSVSITMSDTVGNGRYMTVTNVSAVCIEAGLPIDQDMDGDGYCIAQDSGTDSGGCATQSPPSCVSRHNQWTGATHAALQADTDGDKQSDALETYVGTDPVQSCSASASNNNEPMDNWMFDINDDRVISGQDTGPFGGAGGGFGKNIVNGPFNGRPGIRYDFNSDGIINAQDTGKFGGVGPYGGTGPFNKSCPPGGGTSAGIPAFSQQ